MSNEKRFYSPIGRGGIEEPTNEDARYWQRSAEGALISLSEISHNADALVSEFWNEENTWKAICISTEAVLAEVREQSAVLPLESHAAPISRWMDEEDGTYPSPIISGGEIIEITMPDDDHWYHENPNY
jgi:hypothetical protein